MLKYKIKQGNGNPVEVTLAGRLDSEATPTFKDLAADLFKAQSIVMNLEHIETINTMGIKVWMFFLGEIAPMIPIKLVECSTAYTEHAVMMRGVIGSAKVISFYADFFCNGCDHAQAFRIEMETLLGDDGACVNKCPQCGETMECDLDLPGFVHNMQGATNPSGQG